MDGGPMKTGVGGEGRSRRGPESDVCPIFGLAPVL